MNGIWHFVAIILCVGATKINAKETEKIRPIAQIKGRPLTPEEGCGTTKVANTKIVGGQIAKQGAWPWMALIADADGPYWHFSCGGSLITSRHVLTAAHCVNKATGMVRLGEHDLLAARDGLHLDIPVKTVVKHPKFIQFLFAHDIAILFLKQDVDFTGRIRPICLPIDGQISSETLIDKNPFVAGWGLTERYASNRNTILRQLQIPILPIDSCKEAYKTRDQLISVKQFDDKICAGHLEGGKDTCQGDSGGPMMLPHFSNGTFPFYQIGIISNGIGCGIKDMPGLYTNVASHAEWIKESLQTEPKSSL